MAWPALAGSLRKEGGRSGGSRGGSAPGPLPPPTPACFLGSADSPPCQPSSRLCRKQGAESPLASPPERLPCPPPSQSPERPEAKQEKWQPLPKCSAASGQRHPVPPSEGGCKGQAWWALTGSHSLSHYTVGLVSGGSTAPLHRGDEDDYPGQGVPPPRSLSLGVGLFPLVSHKTQANSLLAFNTLDLPDSPKEMGVTGTPVMWF